MYLLVTFVAKPHVRRIRLLQVFPLTLAPVAELYIGHAVIIYSKEEEI